MADTDPPDKVDDLKSPADGSGVAPDANAFEEQVSGGVEQHHGEHEGDAEAEEPSVGSGTGQHDRADFFGDRAKGVARLDYGSALEFGRRFVVLVHALLASSS